MLLDPSILRHHANADGLITPFQMRELQAEQQPANHNYKFLSYVRPNGEKGFHLMTQVLRKAYPLATAVLADLDKLCLSHTLPRAAATTVTQGQNILKLRLVNIISIVLSKNLHSYGIIECTVLQVYITDVLLTFG